MVSARTRSEQPGGGGPARGAAGAPDADGRPLQAEVERRFGVLPNFFRLAPENPQITANLWGFARFAYLDNPLPALFKERLFVYLSRFCEVRYCIARHVGFLIGLGRPSGDEQCPVQSIEEVVQLLRRPFPRAADVEPDLARCAATEAPLTEMPAPDSALEEALFTCATHVFLQTPAAPACLAALRRLFRPADFEQLLVFLGFIRTAHYWTKVHPELEFEDDIQQLLRTHEELAECLLSDQDATSCDLGQRILNELASLRQRASSQTQALHASDQMLRDTNAELAERGAALAQANAELQDSRRAAMNLLEEARTARREAEQSAAALREREARIESELADARLLQSVSAEIIHEEDVESLYGKIMDAAVSIMRSDFASMQMLYPERGRGGELRLLAFRGFDPEAARFWEWVRTDSRCTCGEALNTGRRAIAANVQTCEFMEGSEDQAAYLRAGILAVQSTPLISRSGKLVGMISTHWRQPHAPSERDLRLLDILARQAADLLERTQSVQAAHRAREYAEATLRTSPVPLLVLERDLRIVTANESFYKRFQVTAEQTEGRVVYDLGNGQWDIPRLRELLENVLPQQSSFEQFEVTHEFESIGRRTMLLNARRMEVDAGGPERIVLVIDDITERKHAEAAGAYLAAIVQNSDDAIITKGLDGIITTWNASAERLFGYTAQEAIGQPITMLIPQDRLDEEPRIIERLTRGERVDHFETRRKRKDGSLLDISLTISPVKDAEGRVVGASKIARDITERKRTEKALRESEARFRMVVDNIDQLAWICEDQLGNATWYNQRWLEYTGMSIEDMQGWDWSKVQHPDHLERVLAGVKHSAETGEPWDDTFPLRGKDGQYRWFLSRAVPIRDERGRIVRWFGTNTDVTEHREAAEALREADRRKDEFLATLAHELRNPLAPISNAVELIRLVAGDPARVEALRETMGRQVQQLVRLIDDLLDVSRISSGKINLRKQGVELWSVVASAVEAARPSIEEGGHELSIDETAEPLRVEADPARLAQVVTNLLTNAARYTPRGGHIWLKTELVRDQGSAGRSQGAGSRNQGAGVREGTHDPSSLTPDSCPLTPGASPAWAVIRVRDNGLGIPPDRLGDIFEMFSQVHSSLDSSQSGLGIGLTLVKSLVELHGGRVTAHSAGPGTGSEFVVRLPLIEVVATPSSAVPTPRIETSRNGRFRVLVVDDSKPVADVFAMMLQEMGHDVEVASSGEDALRRVGEFAPDVLFSDISMPRMSGYELAQRLRELPGLNGVYLVAMTGFGQPEDRERALESGFDHHLVKPATLEHLQSVFGVLAGRAAATAEPALQAR